MCCAGMREGALQQWTGQYDSHRSAHIIAWAAAAATGRGLSLGYWHITISTRTMTRLSLE